MKITALALLFAIAPVIGCKGKPAEEPAVFSGQTAQAKESVRLPDEPDINPHNPDHSTAQEPAWISKLRQIRACIGKNKREFVALLGEPRRAVVNDYSKSGFYEFSALPLDITISFPSDGTVRNVSISFPSRVAAGFIWKGLGEVSGEPTMIKPLREHVLNFQLYPENFKLANDDMLGKQYIWFELKFDHKFADGLVLSFDGRSLEAPVKGEIAFNTETNRKEFTSVETNPAFRWIDVQVRGISLRKKAN